jgi:hypothetical protein
LLLKAYSETLTSKIWHVIVWNISSLSNYSGEEIENGSKERYLIFITAFQKKLFQLTQEPECPNNYKYDLIRLLHIAYTGADKGAKRFIL